MKNTKMLVLVILLASLALALYSFWDVCLTFFTAIVLAYLLNPMARFISIKLKIRHGLAVALVLVLFLALIATLISIILPAAITQISNLVKEIGGVASDFDQLVTRALNWLADLHLPQAVLDKAAEVLSQADTYLLSVFSAILTALLNFSMGLFDLVIVVILVIYFMLDGAKIMASLLAALPEKLGRAVSRVRYTSNLITKKYIKSRIIISAGMGLVTYIGFSIMGIRYALLFAVMSFVLDFIPYFGSIIAGIIEAVYALIVYGPGLAVGVAVFVLVVQQIEGNVVAPKVQGDATGIHPVTVMFALLACSKLFGPIGMLISTPLAGIIKIVYQEAFRYVVTPDDYDPDQLTIDEG